SHRDQQPAVVRSLCTRQAGVERRAGPRAGGPMSLATEWTQSEPDGGSPMTRDEARQCVERINHHLDEARALLLDLYEREGWRALGYASWRECVAGEFPKWRQSYLYYQL